jgi:deoxycytidylate deaminase
MSHNLTPLKAARIAIDVAQQSTMRHRLGCILYDRTQYVTGYNRAFGVTVPGRECEWSMHSEEVVIIKGARIGIDFGSSTLVVIRVNLEGELRKSEPCKTCMRLIKKVGIKHVWYVG